MSSIAKSFTAVGVGPGLIIKEGDSFSYKVSGTFVGTIVLEKSVGGSAWIPLIPSISAAAVASGNVVVSLSDQGSASFRFRCSAFTSGTIVTSITDSKSKSSIVRHLPAAGRSKAGATSGFVVAAADNKALVTCPASQTASTLVIPVPELRVGDKIKGFYSVGQLESVGGTVTFDAQLRVMKAIISGASDSLVGAMTQLSVTAETILSKDNTILEGLDQMVAADENYYFLITVTTGSSCSVTLQGVGLRVEEA